MLKFDDATMEKGKLIVEELLKRHGDSVVPLFTSATVEVFPDYLTELLDFFPFDKVDWRDQYHPDAKNP